MKTKKNLMLLLIMMFWFTISFITNILGPLIPEIINAYHLKDLAMAGFIPTSFFLAYAIMSIPAGIMIDKYGEKVVLLIGFILPFIGTLLFASFPLYPVLLFSCFVIGLGMAMLQTVLNPLQRTVGGEENYAFIAELAQFVFGVASFLSPLLYTWLIKGLEPANYEKGHNFILALLHQVTPAHFPGVSLYWIFAFMLLCMLLIVYLVHFPTIKLGEDEKVSTASFKNLFKEKYVWIFFFGIFCYVSSEQSISIYMSTFLKEYHQIDPETLGAQSISYFWGSMTIGCIVGMILLKLIDSRLLLRIAGFTTVALLLAAIFGNTAVALFAFPALGFCIATMYSIVFSLALNSVSQNHGSFSGILCSGIAGGAVGPLLIGFISDRTSLRIGMLFVLIFIAYIIFIGFWARPLINNKTVSLKQLLTRSTRH